MRERYPHVLIFLCAGWLFLLGGSQVEAQAETRKIVKSGWFLWDPYQFEVSEKDVSYVTGLDVQLIHSIFESRGYKVTCTGIEWEKHQQELRDGTRDIATGVYSTEERAVYAWFSEPYRRETDVLILPKGKAVGLEATSVVDLLNKLSDKKFRLGLIRGFNYGPEVEAFLKNPANAATLYYVENDNENLSRLVTGGIDGFLSDRLVASTVAWHAGLMDKVEEHPLTIYSAGIHVMFSKKSCTEKMVADFNEGLRDFKESGEYNRITRHYVVPVLLGITVQRDWFTILGMIGTFAFAISGVLLARKENYDIFGALLLASLPAVGGGVLRDVLTERYPIGILRSPVIYLYAVLITVVAGALFYKIHDAWLDRHFSSRGQVRLFRMKLPVNIIEFFDAMGLAAFIVTGVVIAVEQQCEPLWLWGPILAAITGAGGGILRDIVRADSNNPSLKGEFYPEVALIWGFFLSWFLDWQTTRLNLQETGWAVFLTMSGAFLTRMMVVRYGIRSLLLGKNPLRLN